MKAFRGIILSILFVLIMLSLITIYWYVKIDPQTIESYFNFDEDNMIIFDDEGFPSVRLSFNSSHFLKIKVVKNQSETVDIDYFTGGINKEAVMTLGSYRESISLSDYTIEFFDDSNKLLFSKDIFFIGGALEIYDFQMYSWEKNNDEKYIMGLNLEVENTGDLPVYLNRVNLIDNNKFFTGLVLPKPLNPNEKTFIDCVFFDKTENYSNDYSVNLFDFKNDLMASSNFQNISFLELDEIIYHNFSNTNNSLSLPYPIFLYDYYQDKDRIINNDYSVYVFDKYDDKFIELITEILADCYLENESFFNASDFDRINYIAFFVQNLEYISDTEREGVEEYPNYPVETVFYNKSGGGDCEDKAILTASILDFLGYNVALIKFSDHMALGVQIEDTLPDIYYFDNSGYYFLETSYPGPLSDDIDNFFRLGVIPKDYVNEEYTLHKISSRHLINHYWKDKSLTIFQNSPLGNLVKASIFIENLGLSKAENISIRAKALTNDSFFEDFIISYSEEDYISYINQDDKIKLNMIIKIDSAKDWYFITEIFVNDIKVDELRSERTFFI